ncbi:uncharacterized protein LOC107264984 [Cephus cinctus]|uniref:Uncharacterized protein LOC107264984 n=1 Tax=Cephus cinctus TaxID=211228 RepID=A0AAJ7BM06_CEPCN|nr:uncharacterized protein LOC107264984 [Cephus cinctus]
MTYAQFKDLCSTCWNGDKYRFLVIDKDSDLDGVAFWIDKHNMQRRKLQEQKDVLRQTAKASDAILKKHRMIKLGRENVEQATSEVSKPVVTLLQKLVTALRPEHNLIKDEIKDEIKQDVGADDTIRSADESFKSLNNDFFEGVDDEQVENADEEEEEEEEGKHYLDMMLSNQGKHLDTAYGVRKVAKNPYLKITGLIELLFKKVPDGTSVTQDDLDNYKNIILTTNAHRKYYKPDGAIRKSKSFKFHNVTAKLIEQPSVTGKGIVSWYMIATKDGRTDYVYWDDPNELVDYLRLILASQEDGNPSHSNEILPIIKELREAVRFKFTAAGHYDIDNKRLCNVADAEEENDAVTLI